jgi:hypothetical protein
LTIYMDTGNGYPPGAAVAAAGVAGVIAYVGTPGRTKNLTAPVVADYQAHGIAVLTVYEDIANDVAGGQGAGVAHAQAALTDMRNLGLPDTTPVCAAADEHLTAGMIPTATAYQAGFYDTVKAAGWAGPVGGYGFSEFLVAIQAAGKADWTWQAGTYPAAGSNVNLWQRNGSDGAPTQMTIAGTVVDIDDVLIPITAPITPGVDMGFNRTCQPGTDEHADLCVAGCSEMFISCSWGQTIAVHDLLFWGPTPAAAPPQATGVGGGYAESDHGNVPWQIDSNRPGPIPIPAGAVTATLRYDAAHDFDLAAR